MTKTSKPTGASRRRSRTPRPLEKLARTLLAFAKVADKLGARWYLFGAQAVAAYGVTRATDDIDITVDLGKLDLEVFAAALQKVGFEPVIADPTFTRETRVYPVSHPATGWKIDLVLAGGGIEQLFFEMAHVFPTRNVDVRVIAPEHLIAIKVLAGRPKDLEDVRSLLAIAKPDRERILETLHALEMALDQSDLVPLFKRLERQATPKKPKRNA